MSTAIRFALFPNSKKRPKTLVDKFYYPKLGAGMLWEKFEDSILKNEIEVRKESKVSSVEFKNDVFNLTIENANATLSTIKAKNIFFSNPLLEFINIYKTDIPSEVVSAASSLNYRNHISVHVTIDKKLFDDNWIYIHSPDLKMARIADFTNFSEFMSNENTYPLTLEYFCFENDELWTADNKNLIEFALSELKTIFDEKFNVVHSAVTRNPKAYPVIKTGYEEHIKIIKNWLETLPNITAIGRSGMFKYNNQDHAMATGLYAARNYLGLGEYDPWEVNIDGEYHEEISGD